MAGEGPAMEKFAQGQSVPSSGGGAGSSLDSLISNVIKPIPDEMVMRAFSPSFSQHSLSVPSKMTQPIPDFKPAAQDNRQVVGKGNARAQGIGNAITGVANGIGAFVNAKAKLKQTANAQKVSQLIEYQQGIDEAKEILKNDPNNADAKAAIEKNQHNRDAMFEDKQFVNTVQKGFNISFTDPEANKTEDHAAVKQGIDLAKQRAASMGQQWADKQPVKPTANILAQQQLSMAVKQQEAYAKVYAAVLPKMLASRDQAQRTQYVQGMMNLRQMKSFQNQAFKLEAQFKQQDHLAGVRHQFKLSEIYQNVQWSGQKMEELFQAEHLDPTVLFKEKTSQTDKFAKNEGTLASALSKVEVELSQTASKLANAKGDAKAQIQKSIQGLQDQKQSIMLQQKNYQDYKKTYYDTMSNLESISAGMSGGSNGSGQPVPNSTNQPNTGANSFNPSTLLNNQPFQYGDTSGTSALLPGSEDDSSNDEEDPDN